MPKIRFTATPKLPADYKHLGYKIGDEISAGQSWCDKWVNRGVAVHVPEDIAVAAEDEDVGAVDQEGLIGVDSANGIAPKADEEQKSVAEPEAEPHATFRGRKPRK